MIKLWDKSKIDLYFEDAENNKVLRQGYNNLIDGVTEEEISTFVDSIDTLHELPVVHAIVSESYRYFA